MIYIFDFDGVISTPRFNDKEGTIMVDPNDFENNIRKIRACYDEYSKPFVPVINVIKRLKDEGNRILILSSCSRGSQEIFAKLDFLDRYMPDVVDRDDFWGVNSSDQKGTVIKFLVDEICHEEKNYREHFAYIDDNLESLIDIEQEILELNEFDRRVDLYHVTTFLDKFSNEEKSKNECFVIGKPSPSACVVKITKPKNKVQFILGELNSLYDTHQPAFGDFELSLEDYENIINKGENEDLTITKEEIDGIFRLFLK